MSTTGSLPLNAPNIPGGQSIATTVDDDGYTHVHDVVEFLDDAGNPRSPNNVYPLSVKQGRVVAMVRTPVIVGDTPVKICDKNWSRTNTTIHNHADDQLFVSPSKSGLEHPLDEDKYALTVCQPHEDFEWGASHHITNYLYAVRPVGADEGPVWITEYEVISYADFLAMEEED